MAANTLSIPNRLLRVGVSTVGFAAIAFAVTYTTGNENTSESAVRYYNANVLDCSDAISQSPKNVINPPIACSKFTQLFDTFKSGKSQQTSYVLPDATEFKRDNYITATQAESERHKQTVEVPKTFTGFGAGIGLLFGATLLQSSRRSN